MRKVGRVRTCRLGPRRLDAESAWIAAYHAELKAHLGRPGNCLDHLLATLD